MSLHAEGAFDLIRESRKMKIVSLVSDVAGRSVNETWLLANILHSLSA